MGGHLFGYFFVGVFIPQKRDLAPHLETVHPPLKGTHFLIKIDYATIALYGPRLCYKLGQ